MSGSSSTWGSSIELPAEGLLSKFAKMLDSVDIIASNRVSEVSWAESDAGVEGRKRRPAYRRPEEEAGRRLGGEARCIVLGAGWPTATAVNQMGIICLIWKQ